jgi:hypothetical protein
MKTMTKYFLGLTVILLACFALSNNAVAEGDDGGGRRNNEGDRGNGNTSEGKQALFSLTTGTNNTADGYQALYSNTTGSTNTAIGFQALYHALTSSTPDENGSTVGESNTAVGYQSLFSNTTGWANAAYGLGALSSNTTGFLNAAMGRTALFNNTTGHRNSAIGNGALYVNTIGNLNTADGHTALVNNTTGNKNIALGESAGRNIINGSSNIDIGYPSPCNGCTATTGPDESNTIRIGDPTVQNATFVAGIRGAATGNADALPVVIDSAGQLGTLSSSERFKNEIKPMNQASEVILQLKPVTFHYKNDGKGTSQFGLIAEQVAKVNQDLVVRDANGQIYTVRYDAVNAMLLNEFLKAHRRIEEQDKRIDQLTTQLKEQAALIQKVNDKVELSKPAPRTVDNN